MAERGRPVILACDTSTTVGSVAIVEGGIVTAETLVKSANSHSLRIPKDILAMLSQRNLAPGDVDAFVTASGPGSFTGVRIAMSTMKGLAWSTGRPLISICSLRALARPHFHRGAPVITAFDARRREVYGALFSADGDILIEPQAISPAGLATACVEATAGESIICVGEGVAEYLEIFHESLGNRILQAAPYENHVRASVLGVMGTEKFNLGEFVDIREAEPVYLRRSEAEINLENRQKHSN